MQQIKQTRKYMLYWVLKERTFHLIGTYDNMFFGGINGNDKVYIDECNYELPQKEVDKSFTNRFNFNPFKGYKFVVNKDKYEKYNAFNELPICWMIGVAKANDKNEIVEQYYSTSNSDEIRTLEKMFQAIGYKYGENYFYARLNYKEVKESEKEGFKVLYNYGAARNCYLMVKK